MSIISDWKAHRHQQTLTSKIKTLKVQRFPVSFEHAQTIGILFDATDVINRNTIRRYAEQLQKKGIKVTLFGFLDQNEADTNLPFRHFTRKDLDWVGTPSDETIEHFINQPFDFLINLRTRSHQVLEYISALSKAHLRVGPYSDKLYCYDLMIDSRQQELDYFIKHIEYFLNRLKSSRA